MAAERTPMARPSQNEPKGIPLTLEATLRHPYVREQRPDETVGQTAFLRLETMRMLQTHQRERALLGIHEPMDDGWGLLRVAGKEELGTMRRTMMDKLIGQAVPQYSQQGPSSSKSILRNPEQNEILGISCAYSSRGNGLRR
jgi:hypothetical protein